MHPAFSFFDIQFSRFGDCDLSNILHQYVIPLHPTPNVGHSSTWGQEMSVHPISSEILDASSSISSFNSLSIYK